MKNINKRTLKKEKNNHQPVVTLEDDLTVIGLPQSGHRAILLLPQQVVIIDPCVRSPFTDNVSVVVLPRNTSEGNDDWVDKARWADKWVRRKGKKRGQRAKVWLWKMSQLAKLEAPKQNRLMVP